MKTLKLTVLIALFTIETGFGQDKIFTNYQLGVRFVTESEWTTESRGDSEVLTIENRNHNIRMRVWHVKSENKPLECIDGIVMEEGLSKIGQPFTVRIDGKKAIAIVTGCIKMHRPYKKMLIVVKRMDGYDVFSASCPEECFIDHCKQLESLLRSFEYIENQGYKSRYLVSSL